jgi:uncharacterized protein YdeI (YjbR/CyaY-like superfamily)
MTRFIAAGTSSAIEFQDRGEAIAPERHRPIEIPPELNAAFDADPEAKAAFDALTPGKRREYADHVSEAKRADTKARRVEKILPMIRAGGGLHDKYRENC